MAIGCTGLLYSVLDGCRVYWIADECIGRL